MTLNDRRADHHDLVRDDHRDEPSGRRGFIGRFRSDPTLRREADMMGFYLSITLLGALTATGNDHESHTQTSVLVLVWGVTIGLALAHWFAVELSIRLVDDPDVHHTPAQILVAQLVMAVTIAGAATIVVLILGPDTERLGARLVAAAAIAVIVSGESRIGGTDWRHSLLRGFAALLLGLTVALIKWNIGK